MSTFNTGSYLTSLHDAALLPYLEKELDKSDDDMFVVLHTYGSHFNYHERYPAEFRIHTPDKAEGIRVSYKKELRNAYDNSIHYTDYVLGEIVDMLKKKNVCSSMLYLSDHGEDIFDDSRARYLHASPIPTYYQLHIPYIIWFSDDYREAFPEKYRTAMSHGAYPVSTNSVFHTVLDIAGVRTFGVRFHTGSDQPGFCRARPYVPRRSRRTGPRSGRSGSRKRISLCWTNGKWPIRKTDERTERAYYK